MKYVKSEDLMGKGKWKRRRNQVRELAKTAALNQHLESIRNYIDGIIGLKWYARLKVCWHIFTKRNPFGGGK
jgi:hypothetical protein